jgi:hypothetical protein
MLEPRNLRTHMSAKPSSWFTIKILHQIHTKEEVEKEDVSWAVVN